MGIQFLSVKCPECGANLSIENGRESAFCSYCGAKVIVNNENEHIYRNIDEARIKEAETDRLIKLKQLEMEEKESVSRKVLIIVWLIATAILLLLGIIGMSINNSGMGLCIILAMNVGGWGALFLFANKKNNRRIIAGANEAVISSAMADNSNKNYSSIAILFRGAGFSNVTVVPLHDLNVFNQMKNGQVESVTIDGNSEFEEGDVFSKNANVLITYHCR
ncbi:zinc ribbon domain-containing protein [Butyrivibrio sp. AD3002]|uniref:zinc ribbon domain-containing protein n=1 Tax=Butyrivibrio sp. AD3002 TaxID=1280670 RepID=UPI0012DF90FC|nr:zinc ribbon domain-containing protein [Butyrivibrio sp. AD3002]